MGYSDGTCWRAPGGTYLTDGQCATIAAAILIIAQDAPEGYKNLTNVYYFLAYMCEPDRETGEMPITRYLEKLPESHPARGAFQVAQIAPFRTRSSFFYVCPGNITALYGLECCRDNQSV